MSVTDYIGTAIETQTWEYNWKDVSLYNLAVGCGKRELRYVYAYRDDFRALPTFALVPSFTSNFITPRTFYCKIPGMALQKAYQAGGLDWDDELELYRPIDCIKGTFMWDYVLEDIYDRGPGKGIVLCNVMHIYDEVGRPVAKNTNRTVMFAQGGFGGKPVPKSEAVFPDSPPDYEAEDFVDHSMHMIYNLATNSISDFPIHIDEDYCKKEANMPGIVVQGHLTMGLACRHAVRLIADGHDERVKKISCQFRHPLFPETPVRFQAWKAGQGKAYFRVVDARDGKPYLNNGVFIYDTL